MILVSILTNSRPVMSNKPKLITWPWQLTFKIKVKLTIVWTVLSWIQSYLSSRSFTVNINNIKSSPFQLLYGVPQGSVLGPLLFILYTTPLSHIISRSSVNHKLYADDTQLFLSFSPCNFQQNIQLLQNTISEISSWMASNFLSLNSSKTEFLLIGLPTQLAKIDNPSLSMPSSTSIKPVASARNLGVIFDSNLSFSDHISYISKTCFAHIRDLRRICNTLHHTTACTIATSLIHSKLDYCNSLFLNLNCQQTNRLQLILNSAARAVTKTPKYNHITPHLKSLHWLKITQRIQYKILSLTYKSLQFKQPSSILDLLKIQPTHSTRSSAVVTPPASFQSISAQNYWQILLPPSSCSLEFTTSPSACSFFNITYSNQLSPLTVFLSIPQTTQNLPFPSILSSLDYLLPGLTLWNSTRPDLHVIHTPFHFSFINTSFIAWLFFLLYMMLSVYRKKLTEIHFCQLYGAL